MSSLAATLNQAWLRRGLLACLLWPLSVLMSMLVRIRRLAYHRGWLASSKLPVPVIVVGNRVVGGAGKTPTTIALLAHLQARGFKPGVLSRGYKATPTQEGPVLIDALTAGSANAQVTGDEPLLIWRRTGVPMMVGRDRAACGHALLAQHPEINILVCDDGLQHLSLQRDIEIVVFDGRGQGNGWLLPAGPLREPINAPSPPSLCAAPIVIYNAQQASTTLAGHLASTKLAPLRSLGDWWADAEHTTTQPQTHAEPSLQGRTTWAVAGIAHPQRFFDALTQVGIHAQGIPLDDHADFAVLPWPVDACDVIVTEKDAVKINPKRLATERPGCRVWVAALDFTPENTFWFAVDAALGRLQGTSINSD